MNRPSPLIVIPASAGMTIKGEFDGGAGIPRCLSRLSFLRMQESRPYRAGCEGRTKQKGGGKPLKGVEFGSWYQTADPPAYR